MIVREGEREIAERSRELWEKLVYLYSSNNRVTLYFDLPVLSKAVVASDDPGRQVTSSHIALSHKRHNVVDVEYSSIRG